MQAEGGLAAERRQQILLDVDLAEVAQLVAQVAEARGEAGCVGAGLGQELLERPDSGSPIPAYPSVSSSSFEASSGSNPGKAPKNPGCDFARSGFSALRIASSRSPAPATSARAVPAVARALTNGSRVESEAPLSAT